MSRVGSESRSLTGNSLSLRGQSGLSLSRRKGDKTSRSRKSALEANPPLPRGVGGPACRKESAFGPRGISRVEFWLVSPAPLKPTCVGGTLCVAEGLRSEKRGGERSLMGGLYRLMMLVGMIWESKMLSFGTTARHASYWLGVFLAGLSHSLSGLSRSQRLSHSATSSHFRSSTPIAPRQGRKKEPPHSSR